MPLLRAVITGDLIGSTSAGPVALAGAMLTVADVAKRVSRWTPGWDTRFTRSRGDSWQIVLGDPALSLRAALLMQARLRAAPEDMASRISIGLGDVDSYGTRDLSDARGEAFVVSGHGLDRMGKQMRMVVNGSNLAPLLQAVADLADDLARQWTREQAEAMALALPPDNPTLAVMAKRLGISKQAVNYRLTGASLRAIRAALTGWETAFTSGLVRGGET